MRSMKLLALVVLVSGLLLFGAPSHAAPSIQPGVAATSGGSLCTLNWIYDGSGGPYVGTAAHCFDSGARVTLQDGGVQFGTVAFRSPDLDYELIRIDAEDVGLINPAMVGHPNIPSGVSTQATAAVGDLMQFSGHGVGFSLLPQTREQRVGVLGYNDGEQHYIYGAVTFGDSGGPVADITDGNKAFGIVDTVGAALTPLPQAGEGGTSLEGLLADAASHGFNVSVRTV